MPATHIPDGFEQIAQTMHTNNTHIITSLSDNGYVIPDYPTHLKPQFEGEAAAKAHPMQGILKYHGMADWDYRTAYLPSISVTTDAAHTLTVVRFSNSFDADTVTLNGTQATPRETERVVRLLDFVRNLAEIDTRAQVQTANIVRASITGKGLGTSASGAAALATATIGAVFGSDAASNVRFVSSTARLLAGSGTRSAAGGVALWLSYPGIAHEDSYAIRLDTSGQTDDLALITVPMDSRLGLKTELAHGDAPRSPLFQQWMLDRYESITEAIGAVLAQDMVTLGQMAEIDSIRLHSVTMTGSRDNKIFAWEPENIHIFRLCNTLRSDGIPVYFSTDTGPTVVLMTTRGHVEAVVEGIHGLNDEFGLSLETVVGNVADGATLVDVAKAEEILSKP